MNISRYARAATSLRHGLDPEIEELHAAGCETIFREKMTSGTVDRGELARLIAVIDQGETL